MRKMAVLLLFSLCTATLAAQTTEHDILARLKGKPLFLRGMWGEDSLAFDKDGNPLKSYIPTSFTLAAVDVKSVKLRGDHLQIAAQRVGLTFDPKARISRQKIETATYDGHIVIDIQGPSGTDFTKAIDTIFAFDLESLSSSLPGYWQFYARHHFLSPGSLTALPPDEAKDGSGVAPENTSSSKNQSAAMHVGGAVKPPRVLKSVDPEFTLVAKALKFSGNVQVYLWLEKDGTISHLHIVRPAGLGLDENAIAALQRYKFAVATQNGDPVTVDLYIDVNFQIF